ncbi:hypothetical protein RF007C_13265 [Ruminococcus flavefaciens 007c]|uniref:Uncharacterized protein n=1 Tax=Ruminococcus flavefaciens 007c TaxID=1341157 RepID=W7UL61_RUMFL|nr:hypothetical protein RF007C_13265 [Ruminococcus flavefaciens 007c]
MIFHSLLKDHIQSADEVASDVIDGKLNPFHHDNGKEEAK